MDQAFAFGDNVRHPRRPEWGVGQVTRAEAAPGRDRGAQRLTVRFSNGGLRTLDTSAIALERVDDSVPPVGDDDSGAGAGFWDEIDSSTLPESVARRRIEEIMHALPESARDPFRTLRDRIESTLELYRFTRSGVTIVDWAITRTGLADPLSRFNRHELEQYFDRWASERDAHLRRLVDEAERSGENVRGLLRAAPAAARSALSKSAAR